MAFDGGMKMVYQFLPSIPSANIWARQLIHPNHISLWTDHMKGIDFKWRWDLDAVPN